MRLFALIGAVLLLVAPFAITSWSVGENLGGTDYYGYLFYSSEGDFFGWNGEKSSSFSLEWFEDGNVFDLYFGDLAILGIITLVLIIATIALAFIDGSKSKRAPGLLIICGILLLVLRLMVLGDNDLSLYES